MLDNKKEYLKDAMFIRDMAMQHEQLFRESIPLIASENIMSPLAMEMLLTDLGFRYAEGLPHHRYYQGNEYVDVIEDKTTELGKRLFNSKTFDPRPLSGTNANMAVLYALTEPGDKISVPPLSGGGHISAAKFGAVGFRGLKTVQYPFDINEMNIDIDGTIKTIKNERPKVCWFGQSVFLFPTPLKELQDAFNEVNARVVYDGAHVAGLIAGGEFQDPLREGAEIITGSTHKTLPGPQHGMIIGNTDDDTWKKVQRGVFPGTLSNHHLNAMAALGVTLAEELDFGRDYAKQIVKNARHLGEKLYEFGFNVLGEKNGFTRSHTLAVDVSKNGGGRKVAENLEKSGIILNKNLLPWDDNKNSQNPSGIRIGVQEITRIGFMEDDVTELAEILRDAVINEKPVNEIRRRALELKSRFNNIEYCYGNMKPYSYIKIFE